MTPSKKTSNTSGKNESQDMSDSIVDLGTAAADLGSEAKEQVTNLTDQLRQQATNQLTAQKEQIVDGLETVALLLHQAGEHAQQQDKALIANYVDKAAQQVSAFSESIGQQDVTQVVETTKDFARREPMLFVGGALLAGFLGARFMRSSTAQAEQMGQAQSTNDSSQPDDMNVLGTGLPAYDIDQTSSASSDDAFGATGFSDEYQTDVLDSMEEEVGSMTLTDLEDLDGPENL